MATPCMSRCTTATSPCACVLRPASCILALSNFVPLIILLPSRLGKLRRLSHCAQRKDKLALLSQDRTGAAHTHAGPRPQARLRPRLAAGCRPLVFASLIGSDPHPRAGAAAAKTSPKHQMNLKIPADGNLIHQAQYEASFNHIYLFPRACGRLLSLHSHASRVTYRPSHLPCSRRPHRSCVGGADLPTLYPSIQTRRILSNVETSPPVSRSYL